MVKTKSDNFSFFGKDFENCFYITTLHFSFSLFLENYRNANFHKNHCESVWRLRPEARYLPGNQVQTHGCRWFDDYGLALNTAAQNQINFLYFFFFSRLLIPCHLSMCPLHLVKNPLERAKSWWNLIITHQYNDMITVLEFPLRRVSH